MHSSAFSTSWWTDRVALYGSTTVSDTLGDGKTEKVSIMRSGYSSRILEMRRVPIPEPVPPPREWHTWKPGDGEIQGWKDKKIGQKLSIRRQRSICFNDLHMFDCPNTFHTKFEWLTLQAVAVLCLLANDIQHGVDQLGTLGVVTLSPVVAGTGLSEDKVVWTENLSVCTSADAVDDTGLEILEQRCYQEICTWDSLHGHGKKTRQRKGRVTICKTCHPSAYQQDGTGNISATAGLIKVHVGTLELQERVSLVASRGVDAVLLADNLPELSTNLVAALACLDVKNLSHGVCLERREERGGIVSEQGEAIEEWATADCCSAFIPCLSVEWQVTD